ncbi:MAG: hypothetical protein QXX95_04705 [Nitrososphaerales archaeon]
MPDFKKLLEEVLKKANLEDEELKRLIEDKKQKVGSGYLTDQGALFLVASDLGIDLEPIETSLSLKDIYVGADEVSLPARILSINDVKVFQRSYGGEGKYRRVMLFDKDSIVPLNLWDDKVDLIESLGLRKGSAVMVSKAYVRADLNGKPVLNLGKRGNLEPLSEEKAGSLPKIEDIAKDVSEISEAKRYLVLRGIVSSKPHLSRFTRKDGFEGSFIEFHFKSIKSDKEIRVIIWNPKNEEEFLNLESDSEILMVNLRSKESSYGVLEIHGDDKTWFEILGKYEDKRNLRIFKVLSKGIIREGKTGLSLSFLVRDPENYHNLIVKDKALDLAKNIKEGDCIKCKIYELRDAYICYDYLERIEETDELKNLDASKLIRKIKSLNVGEDKVFAEVIALSKSRVEEFTAKDGSTFRKAELVVGDDTGESKLIGWRDLADLILNINPGERLFLKGVAVREGKDKSIFLQLTSYSNVEKR